MGWSRSRGAAVIVVLAAIVPLKVLGFTPDASSVGKQQVSTDRQSSPLGDMDRKSELDRRIEDGLHYDHEEHYELFAHNRHYGTIEGDDSIPTARGIFCGYRCTHDEYERLKSAHVD